MSAADDRREFLLPCPGFSETWVEDEIDREIDDFAELLQQERGGDYEAFRSNLSSACDFFGAFDRLARAYSTECNSVVLLTTGIDLGIEFQAVEHPEEYNFVNDKVFATMTVAAARQLFDISAADRHAVLGSIVHDECSHRDGFFSFYSPDLEEWLEKPFEDWDWLELTLCAKAALQLRGLEWEAIDEGVMENFQNVGTVHRALEDSIRWDEVSG